MEVSVEKFKNLLDKYVYRVRDQTDFIAHLKSMGRLFKHLTANWSEEQCYTLVPEGRSKSRLGIRKVKFNWIYCLV